MVDLNPSASFVEHPCYEVVLRVLEAAVGNHKPVYPREIYQASSVSTLRV